MSSAPRTHQEEREDSKQPLKRVGKSSIIYMLAGRRDTAETSGDTMGQPFENVRYSIDISTEFSIDE
ncbi:hypothetical protein H2248_002687 [Termitomyces sp. 'cryptogamus']|nr:hypothetical protein H2248_002687 [Termitomyces sp. 'cryptogamus']